MALRTARQYREGNGVLHGNDENQRCLVKHSFKLRVFRKMGRRCWEYHVGMGAKF